MKNLSIILVVVLIFSCTSDTTKETEKNELEKNIVTNFFKDINSLKKEKNPIIEFQKEAEKLAEKSYKFSKENMSSVITDAGTYKHTILIVGNHTIVSIVDLEDCKNSNSWAECMPMSEGYIKKGELIYKKDYSNNIIGLPDSQKRVAYFFNF